MPVEGCFRADEPQPDSVHDLVHRQERRRAPRSVQGADGREGGVAEESPRAARWVVLPGSVRFVRLRYRVRYRVRYQPSDGRLLRSAASSGVLQPVPPVGEAWCCGLPKARRRVGVRARTRATGARRTGVLQVHVDPQGGSARGARAFV